MARSKLEHTIKEKVNCKERRLVKEVLDPWLMAFLSNTRLLIKNYYGDTIRYQGIKFEGSPQNVFWSNYIDPFIKDFIDEMVNYVSLETKEHKLNLKKELSILSKHLNAMINNIFAEMSEIEFRLLKLDNLETFTRNNSQGMLKYLEDKIDECKCKNARFRWWYPAKWFWVLLLSISLAIAGLTDFIANIITIFRG